MNRSRAWPLLLLLCALAFVQRAGIVLAPDANLYGVPKGGDLGIKIGEEIARGNLALDLIEGPILPLIDYQYAHWLGGSLVIGILTVPSFLVFGPRLWALKLVPVLIHLVGLVLLFRLLDRHVSRRAALLGGLLYGLSPPGYAQLTTIAWGSHVEGNVIAIAALSLYLGLREAERRVGRRLALGVVLGFGLWFGYQTALVVAALALFDLPRAGRPSVREAGAQAAGMAIGLVPWLIYNLRFDFAGLGIYGEGIGGHLAQVGLAERLTRLVTHGLPGTLHMGSRWLDVALALVLAACVLAGLGARARPALVAGAYVLLFFLAYALSDFQVGRRPDKVVDHRYAMLLAPWVAIAAGCGLDALATRGAAWARVAWAGAAGLAATCLVATWIVSCDPSRLGADRDAPGADIAAHGRWLCMKFLHDPKRIRGLVDRIVARRDPQAQREMFDAMGTFLRGEGKPRANDDDRKREERQRMNYAAEVYLAQVPEPYKAAFRRKR